MTKAVGYIRVSTEEQTQHGYSLEAQAQAIKKYCELQGWELVRIYRDDGNSGASMERPDLHAIVNGPVAKPIVQRLWQGR